MRYCAIVQRLGSNGFELSSRMRDAHLNIGALGESGRPAGFAQQPTWSIEISTITDPGRMPTTIALVTSLGVTLPGTSTAPSCVATRDLFN
ncbi:MAG: hypothetical protein WB384_18395 [Candidatus Sulfotelmatobacter sp.]|jgi:hypothetical protein